MNSNPEAMRDAQSVAQMQELVNVLAHDMGAPLRAIVQFSSLLQQSAADDLPQKQRHWLQIINENGVNAQQMLEALSIYSRLGREGSHHGWFSLDAVLARVVENFDLQKAAKPISIEVRVSSTDIYGCQSQWQQLLHCLLDNALRYQTADTGHHSVIIVTASITDKEFTLAVEDNGMGVAAELQPLLTLPFKRIDPSGARPGMGLAYCERIAQLHGGGMSFTTSSQGGLVAILNIPASRFRKSGND
ncbi:sensor histidine kinase [Marinobacterium jannaschii]|uniref:sensor histidine kinase n=1 Tax=Marinobacterium jannaschii TaxID=64970 RepID=UPI0004882C39|nr:HAMP domain-containing sensor histidine kinase [Marinobacterium jannaschii]